MSGKDIALYDAARLARDEARVEEGFWRKIRRTLGRIPFAEEAIAAYYCATDRGTPTYVRAVLMGALGYFIVPTDFLPDFIAMFGYTDDATVLYTALSTVRAHLKPEHYDKARRFLEQERAKSE